MREREHLERNCLGPGAACYDSRPHSEAATKHQTDGWVWSVDFARVWRRGPDLPDVLRYVCACMALLFDDD